MTTQSLAQTNHSQREQKDRGRLRWAIGTLGVMLSPWLCVNPVLAQPASVQAPPPLPSTSVYGANGISVYGTNGLGVSTGVSSTTSTFRYSVYEYPGYAPRRVIVHPGYGDYGYGSINNSVLVNPTIVNSPIYNSTLINPTIITAPALYPTYQRRTVIRYAVPAGATGVTLPLSYPTPYSPPIFHP